MTIAITGATGQLGRLVVAKLKGKVPAGDIVALARSPAKAADLGVTVREADYAKPETLASALAGVDTLLLISSNEVGKREAQHRNVIDAAKKAGVKRIVYTSLLHADTSPLDLAAEHLADRKCSEGFRRPVHDPGQRLVHRKLRRLYCRRPCRRSGPICRAGEGKISSAAVRTLPTRLSPFS